MSLTAQFVDSISDTAAVRLDLNDHATWEVKREDTSTPPPPLRRVTAGTPLVDGEVVPAAAHGNRTVRISLRCKAATADAAAAAVQALTRELHRPTNFLRWRPDTTKAVYFRTMRSEYNELHWDPVQRKAKLDILAEPHAYGPEEFLFPQPLVITDTFTRTVANGWGNANTGQAWLVDEAAAAQFSTNGAVGVHTVNAIGAYRSRLAGVNISNCDMRYLVNFPVSPTGGHIRTEALVRYVDAANHVAVRALINVGNGIDLQIVSITGGVETPVNAITVAGVTHIAGTSLLLHVRAIDNVVQAAIWRDGQTEPTWQISGADPAIRAGTVAVRTLFAPGNTNTLPVNVLYDNITVTEVVAGVVNDPAVTGGMFLDISGVKGDVETPMILRADQADVNAVTGTAIGIRRRGVVADVPFASQAEAWTLLTDTTLQANDPTASGAGQNYVRCSFATNATLVDRMTIAFPPVPSPAARGLYRVFARCRNTVGISSILSLRLSGSPTALALLGTGWSWGHLGYVAVPGGTDQTVDFAGQPIDPGQVQLTVQAERLSGAASLDIDCFVFVPADDGHALVAWSSHGATGWTVLDGTTDLAYALDSAGRIVPSTPPPVAVPAVPMLAPGLTNRLYLVKRAFALSGVDTLTEAVRLDLSYYPRYLFVRPLAG